MLKICQFKQYKIILFSIKYWRRNSWIINAGAYTHTSVAIHDALKILKIPIIELHISNIYNREEFRHKSLISKVANSVICGFGADGYIMALKAMKNFLNNENW